MPAEQIYEIPVAFLEAFEKAFGRVEREAFVHAVETSSPASIRLNPLKSPAVPTRLRQVRWCSDGYYVDARPTFGIDPLWHAGAYYVQEASSMFVSRYLSRAEGDLSVALDLCAAPGGKSTLLRSGLSTECLLISNEPDRGRATILHENILRYRPDEVIVTNAYPDALRRSGIVCDLILVDAPCSGEGMFRKDPASRSEWSPGNVETCVSRQREILDEAWQMLRPGGMLIYSTCTYNRQENEEQLQYLLNEYDVAEIVMPDIDDPEAMGIVRGSEEGVFRFLPHRVEGEGFAIFAVRKGDGAHRTSTPKRDKKTKGQSKSAPIPMLLKECLPHLDHISETDEGYIYLSPKGQEALALLERAKVRVLGRGVMLGELKGKDFIPHHAWAMSCETAPIAPFPVIELTGEQAVAFLKRESIILPEGKGFQIVAYRGVRLGWVKNLGPRSNNLYPKELSLRNKNVSADDIVDFFK